jgi:enoyl-CoA hydratase/carnithine racemase
VIEFSTDGDVGVARLVRPGKRNALTLEGLERLADVGSWAGHGGPLHAARALLLCGEGTVFCAGFDLDCCRGEDGQEALRRLLRGLSGAIAALRGQERPVVVAAQGAAIAGGAALLGGADVVVADAGAKLGYPVARLGISPAVSAPFLRGIGDAPARTRLLDPGLVDGREGLLIGLVHELVDRTEDVLPRAMEIARGLAAKPGEGVAATRRWLDELAPVDAAAGLAVSESVVGSPASRGRLEAMWASREQKR